MSAPRIERAYVVALTIPDNEAYTALRTLERLSIVVGDVQRSDVWVAELDPEAVQHFDALLPTLETLFNPNKHRLSVRETARPLPGEVWIAAVDETVTTTIGGRVVPGLRGLRRRTAWRLTDAHGNDVAPGVLDRATETFLCNPAFQKAIR